MDVDLLNSLLEDTIDLLVEENKELVKDNCGKFVALVREYLPEDVLDSLKDIAGDDSFLEDIWCERLNITDMETDSFELSSLDKCCQVCERHVRLTRHHLFPRETHKALIRKGHEKSSLIQTVSICRMCHSTIHRFFSNDELSSRFYTIDLLLSDDRFYKYARWAASQNNSRNSKVK